MRPGLPAPLLRFVYDLAWWLALPALPLRLWWRGRKEPGYRVGIGERFGRYSREKPAVPLIWLHAVSLGETRAAQPVARALMARYPDHKLLVTHMTATGRSAAEELFPDAIVAFLPYDYPFAVRRFLAHFRPRIGLLMETEVWPNLVFECRRRLTPLVLVNARLSARSMRGYQRVAPLAREAFGALSAVAAQSEADAARLAELGAPNISVTGNVKFDVQAPPAAESLAARLRGRWGGRPVLVCASTREGEESLILDALARRPLGDALVVIVPRHPQRFDEVARLLAMRGILHRRRSSDEPVPPEVGVVLGDSMGELAAYYRAADVAFVGGSLLPFGAQNLIEACAAGVPVLIGPSSFNFAQAAELATEARAAHRVENADDLMVIAARLLGDPRERKAMGRRGLEFAAEHRGATARVMSLVEGLLG